MAKYEVYFKCTVMIEAINADEAIKKAWLIESLTDNAIYKYLSVKKIEVVP
jgi:hypothetical protein